VKIILFCSGYVVDRINLCWNCSAVFLNHCSCVWFASIVIIIVLLVGKVALIRASFTMIVGIFAMCAFVCVCVCVCFVCVVFSLIKIKFY